jgi:hypothetical protein
MARHFRTKLGAPAGAAPPPMTRRPSTVLRRYNCNEALLEQLAEASEHSHPAEALKAYAYRVERMVGLGGQSNYEYACRIVGRMRQLREGLGETTQHAAYLGDLKSRHNAKRNFMKLLTAGDA